GDFNTGDFNTGNYNVGDFNTGGFNTGFLCTGKQTVEIFNKPSNLTYHELYSSKAYGVVRSIFDHDENDRQGYWDSLKKDDQKQVKRLPNFDAQIFKQITGVSVGEDEC
ncbi:pentapeptide repeat-containing protein, partial [Atopobium deltae]